MNKLISELAFKTVLAIEKSLIPSEVLDAVKLIGSMFGYDRYVLFAASSARDNLVDRIYWVEGNWFESKEDIDAKMYIYRCPVTQHLINTKTPFFWRKTENPDGERYQIIDKPAEDTINGIQIPIFGPLGLEGAMSLGGENIDFTAEARITLTLVANASFARIKELTDSPSDNVNLRLSKREREILVLTAAGRRQNEIAAILWLSERTIENHLRRIRKRLGANTTAQAISTAITNGEIRKKN